MMAAQDCARLKGHSVVICRCRTADGFSQCPPEAIGVLTPTYPPEAYRRVQAQPVPQPAALTVVKSYTGGYTGSICDNCGSARMRRAGTCEVCEECGNAGGCG